MRVSVLLTKTELDALGDLAFSERRPPREQAAYLIVEGLRERGLIETVATPSRGVFDRIPTGGDRQEDGADHAA